MSKISAIMHGQRTNRYCKQCGKPIVYGINGAQISEYCFECKPITYHCKTTPIRSEANWDELDALEDRCLGDDID